MLDDAFKLTLDKYFIRPKEYERAEVKYSICGYDDNFNMW
jgi:hypothetical protein